MNYFENSVKPKSNDMAIPSRAAKAEGVETMHEAPAASRGEDIVRTCRKLQEVGRNALSGALFALVTIWTFNGWQKIAAASSTLAEASSNAAVNLSSRKVNVTIASYGRAVKLTELLELTSILPPVEGAMRELEHSARLTLDNAIQLAVFKNVLSQVGQNTNTKTLILSAWMSATASSFAANTGTSGSSNQFGFPVVFGTTATRLSAVSSTAPTISAKMGPVGIRKAVVRLRRLAVEPMADGRYVGITHPLALATMFGNYAWQQWQLNYAGGPQQTIKSYVALGRNP